MNGRAARVAILVGGVLTVASCAGSAVDRIATTASNAAPPTDALSQATIEPVPGADGLLTASGLVYLRDAERDWTVQVFFPESGGPFPLIVVVPPSSGIAYVGPKLASRGAVVVVADSWSTTAHYDPDAVFSGEMDRAACIVGWAQAHAAEFGGLAGATLVTGYSAGAPPAAWVGLGLADDTACPYPITDLPVGLVLGDTQLLFHHERWDPAFADDRSGAASTLDGLIDPDRWIVSPDLRVALWSAARPFGEVRPVEDPPGPDSWIWLRDRASPCVDDLTAVGAFDDGQIDWADNARLIERRMVNAGIDVRNEVYDIPHAYTNETYDLIFSILP